MSGSPARSACLLVLLGLVARTGLAAAGDDPVTRWCRANRCAVVTALPAAEVPAILAALPPVDPETPVADPAFQTQVNGCDLAWLGRVLVIERSDPTPIRRRLMHGVPAEVAAVLLRGDDGGFDNSEAIVTRLIEAARILYQRDRSAPAITHLTETCYWIAAAEFDEILRLAEGVEQGTAILQIHERPPDEAEPDAFYLTALVPLPSLDHPRARVTHSIAPLLHRVAGPAKDEFQRQLIEAGGTIGVEEFTRRVVAESVIRDRTEPPGEEWYAPFATPVVVGAAAELVAALADGAEPPPVATAPRALLCCATGQPRRDVYLAVLRAAGLVRRTGVEAVPPSTVAEHLEASQPLRWWAAGHAASGERMLAEQRLRRRFWDDLAADTRAALEGRWLWWRDTPAEVTGPLGRHIELRLGRELSRWLQNLPDPAGVVPLWLYYDPEKKAYELASPGCSELLRGTAARRLELAITGRPYIPLDWQPQPVEDE